MKFFSDCWVAILYLFGGGYNAADPTQQPLPDGRYHFPDEAHGAKDPPQVPIGRGPRFGAPNSPIEEPFQCDYSAMGSRWKACSTADDRGCWLKDTVNDQDFNINTDYETRWPNGTTRRYHLDVSDMPLNQDGVVMPFGMAFNQSYPGPWIQACWGDDIEVTVTNKLTKSPNGTTIHWHGVRQLNNFQYDGVNGVTMCPTPPGSSFTYKFKVTQYGTTWYHSHYSLQYSNGLLGPMTFYGPSSANYDLAIKPTLMTDWNHNSAFTDIYKMYLGGGPPNMTSILLNGIGNYAGTAIGGEKYNVTLQSRKRYLMRIINTSVDTSFVFTIDNHTLEVMTTDFVPIKPYKTQAIVVGIGQRYHVVVEAHDYPSGQDLKQENFWIRTIPATGCAQFWVGDEPDERQGVLRYDEKSVEVPTSHRFDNLNITCRDEDPKNLVPIVPWNVPDASNKDYEDGFDVGFTNNTSTTEPPLYGLFRRWVMGPQPLWVNFSDPLILNLDRKPEDFDPKWVVIPEDYPAGSWVYLLIVGDGAASPDPGDVARGFITAAHPIHLHGHDFVLLQQSDQQYVNASVSLQPNRNNPPRRDVVLLPRKGFVLIAFKADNPGAWLIHCHIAWHASSGLAMQILERQKDIKPPLFKPDWLDETNANCRDWKKWFANPSNLYNPDYSVFQDDSGV